MKNLLKKKITIENETVTSTVAPATSKSVTGFTKIDPILPIKTSKKNRKKNLLIFGSIVVLLLIVVVVFGIWPITAAVSSAKKLATTSQELASALKNQDLEMAKNKIPQVKQQLAETQSRWDGILLLKFLPFINLYHQDGAHALKAGEYGLEAMDIAVTAIEPYADLLGLKSGSSFVATSADQRIQLAVATLDKMTPKIAEIGQKVEKLKVEVDNINPNRYPEKVRGMSVRAKLIDGKKLLDETVGLFLNARPLLEVLPQLLGEPEPRRYIVIFQNDKELRPTGGFMTAYAHFRLEHGKFIVEKSDDIYELDGQIKKKLPAPTEILTYHKGVYYFNIRDSNLSPDFKISMEKFIELHPNQPFDFDGIIAVDTHVLVEAIKILGEFNIAGRKFNAEIDPRCDCPRVIYELEDYATRPVAYVRETRKDILGALLLEIMKKALGVSPSQYWGQLFQMGIREINEKHILAFMLDEKAQNGVESLNMGGRIANGSQILGYTDDAGWDYLHINDANMAGAKSNLFMEHFVKQEYKTEKDGTILKTVTIDYKNPAPPSDCNLERGNLCLNGILRNWVRIYVPKGSELIESKGSQSPKDEAAEVLKVREELGKTVFEGFLTVRPLGSGQLTLTYKLPFKKSASSLSLFLQKQPGTAGHEYTLVVNGKQKEKFDLTYDRVLTLNL